ncbi:trans-4-hydroxy-L-proline dehydratase [Gemmatimonadota bacterium]
MSDRITRLREQSLNANATLSPERARLITEFYRSMDQSLPVPVQRGLAFRHIMENKSISILEGELIVGERGPAPKATPTYPEVCCHSLEDLDILDSREKVSYCVNDETRSLFAQEIIPFWEGNTIRDRIFASMTDEWKDAYEAGIFTEFMEQRAPGHTVLDDKIYQSGFLDFIDDINYTIQRLVNDSDTDTARKLEQLHAMEIAADALIRYSSRLASLADELAATENAPERRTELEKIGSVCRRVPAEKPRDFHEALQYYWFVHVGVTTELNTWDAFNPGHLDQHLYPFYRRGIDDGTLTDEHARELLHCFWIKFNNQPAPPKVGVTAEESSTYTDFAQINSGGLTADGEDAVNELTFIILDVIEDMRLVQPSSSVQLSSRSPDQFLRRAGRIIRTGVGQPSIFNADLIVRELVRQGKSLADARQGGSSGCVEVGAFGKENYNLTGYFNMPKVFEITLNNGIDPRTGRQIGLETGDPVDFASINDLIEAYRLQIGHFIDIKVAGNDVIERIWAEHLPTPFLSLLIDDCVWNGMDYHEGGARYNTSYIQGVGLGTLTDAVTAVKHHVFDRGDIAIDELLEALAGDFTEHERLMHILVEKTPKFGNDDDYADEVMKELFEIYFNAIDGRPNTRGGRYHINLLPTTCHIYFGSVCGASADGRKAGMPLSEGVSPVQGADRLGPTAVLKSVGKIDHERTGGTLLNQKLTPHLLEGENGLDRFVDLVRSYFRMDGHHIQFNVVDSEMLKLAQNDPEQYRDLIVRVAGYSDYFCDLGKVLQDEIIARTEHRSYGG